MPLRIKELRREKGWTQAELAERANISRSQLTQIEGGARPANTLRLQAIAEALQVPVSDLFDDEPEAAEKPDIEDEHPFVVKLRMAVERDAELTPTGLARRAGLNARAIHDLLGGRAAVPRLDTAEAICRALGTTLSQFTSNEEAEEDQIGKLEDDEKKLLNMYQRLTDDEKAEALRFVRSLFPFD